MEKLILTLAILSFSYFVSVGQDVKSSETKIKVLENQLLNSCLELKKSKVDSLKSSGVSLKSSKVASYKLYEILLKQMKRERVMSNFNVEYVYTERKKEDLERFKLLIEAGTSTSFYVIAESDEGTNQLSSGRGFIELTDDGETVLHTGKATKDAKIVSSTEDGLSALDYAIKNKLRDFIIILNKKPNLVDAVKKGDLQEVTKLIQKGNDINEQDALGNTSLNVAVQENVADQEDNIEIIKFLISKDADINIKNKGGYSPLMNAVVFKNYEISKLLINHGADINTKDNDGMSPLYAASGNNMVNIVKLLLDAGADVNILANNGFTPLVIAVVTKNKEITSLLLNSNADIDRVYSVQGYNLNIFKIAADINNSEIIELLKQYQGKQ